MTTVQDEILKDFFTRLGKAEGFDEEQVEALRALFKSSDKLKADDLVTIFSAQKKKEGAL